jgi:hypothetical protein
MIRIRITIQDKVSDPYQLHFRLTTTTETIVAITLLVPANCACTNNKKNTTSKTNRSDYSLVAHACIPSILKDINVKVVEIQRVIEPRGIKGYPNISVDVVEESPETGSKEMSCCLYCIFFRFDLNPATVVLDGR